MDAVELRYHRLNTDAFIDHRPSTLELIPLSKAERTASGGKKQTVLPTRDPQKFRIIDPSARSTPATVKAQDGTMREVVFVLLGNHDAIVEKDDHWEAEDGRWWVVADIIRNNGYEVKALVVERGQ